MSVKPLIVCRVLFGRLRRCCLTYLPEAKHAGCGRRRQLVEFLRGEFEVVLREGLPFAAQFQKQPNGGPAEAGSSGGHEERVSAPALCQTLDEIERDGAQRRESGDGSAGE